MPHRFEITKGRLIIGIACAAVVAAFGLYSFLYAPLIGKAKITALECKNLESELFKAHAEIASLKQNSSKRRLISERDVSLSIDELSKGEGRDGLKIISVTPRQVIEEKEYNVLPVEIEIGSAYEGIISFLGALDELQGSVVTIERFNISCNRDAPLKLRTTLTLNMYIVKAQ